MTKGIFLPVVETDNLEGDFEGLIDGLECVTSTEASGPEINSAWAQKLNNIWAEDNNMHSMKPIMRNTRSHRTVTQYVLQL